MVEDPHWRTEVAFNIDCLVEYGYMKKPVRPWLCTHACQA